MALADSQKNKILKQITAPGSFSLKNRSMGKWEQILHPDEITRASQIWSRARTLFAKLFSGTGGLVRSPLDSMGHFMEALTLQDGIKHPANVWMKRDDLLPVCGSVKARGGFFEIVKLALAIAEEAGLPPDADAIEILAPKYRSIYAQHRILCGSTGNLGLSIGLMSSLLGFEAEIHMSNHAKEWKKNLLRERGVKVVEHDGSYADALKVARANAAKDPMCHFVDDENSKDLLLGYAMAGAELAMQLYDAGTLVNERTPLYVYIPCGVGSMPAGLISGLTNVFKGAVIPVICEPKSDPALTLASLMDDPEADSAAMGIDAATIADGLAVTKPGSLAYPIIKKNAKFFVLATDNDMLYWLYRLHHNLGWKLEPSALAGMVGFDVLTREKCHRNFLSANHVIWATGGSLAPASEFDAWLRMAESMHES